MTPPTSQPMMATQRPPAVQDPVPGNVFFFLILKVKIFSCVLVVWLLSVSTFILIKNYFHNKLDVDIKQCHPLIFSLILPLPPSLPFLSLLLFHLSPFSLSPLSLSLCSCSQAVGSWYVIAQALRVSE